MAYQKKTKRSTGLSQVGLGAACTFFAFAGWGYLNSMAGAQPAPAAANVNSTASVKALPKADLGKKQKPTESSVLFNDPFMQMKWGLEKTHAAKAWEITKGTKDIVIAVIDTGIDEKHKDLAGNLWKNPGETGKDAKGRDKATNGIDDDGNGFVDDIHGWNFVQNDNKLVDNHGHGTHIAGIIAAKGEGIAGVAPNVSVMVLKYYDPKASNSNNLKNTIQAIRYAIKMKAQIINYSGGGMDYSAEEFAAVKEAEKAGILFVAAAGNERSNSDEPGKHYYPADYGLSNIISVTAVNKEDTKVLASSNYGVRTVDLAAPGENIYSTMPGNSYGPMTGTSQATAFVTGVAALIMSHHRDFDVTEVKKYILRTGDEYATLLSKTGTAKLLNSYKALTSLDKGVSLTGVMASNTARMGAKTFSSDKAPANAQVNVVGDDPNEAPAGALAMFGKDFMKAVGNGKDTETQEIRKR